MRIITQILLVFSLFFVGCAIPSSFIKANSNSPTSLPTILATTSTPVQTADPNFLIRESKSSIIRMEADGIEREIIKIPDDGYVVDLKKAVAPNGKWLTYYTGTSEAEPYDLTLNILNLETKESLVISNLISDGFPNNLKPVFKVDDFPQTLRSFIMEFELVEENAKFVFLDGIHANRWSPDSKRIAFAAQIEGHSTDIYIYDLETQSLRRLTNETDYIGFTLEWSPDGKKLLYASALPGPHNSPQFIRVADANLESPQNPPILDGGNPWVGYDWISDDAFLIFNSTGGPSHHFRYINIENKTVVNIWEGATIDAYYIDIENQRMFVKPYTHIIPSTEEPLLEISFHGEEKVFINDFYHPLNVKGFSNSFFAYHNNNLYTIDYDKNITLLKSSLESESGYYLPLISPDRNWALVIGSTSVDLYNNELNLINTLEIQPHMVNYVLWRPDSKGVFIHKHTFTPLEEEIYYLSIPNGELNPIMTCNPEDVVSCIPPYVWLP